MTMRAQLISNATRADRECRRRTLSMLWGFIALTLLIAVGHVGSARAAVPAAGFTIDSFAIPSSFSAADTPACLSSTASCNAYRITVTNAGSQASDGSPIVVSDSLPAGLTVQAVSFFWSGLEADLSEEHCETLATPVQCTFPIGLAPDETLEMTVYVTVDPGAASGLTNTATVSGGGAPTESMDNTDVIGPPPGFGVSAFHAYIAGLDGGPDTQAGDHPYEFTTSIDLNNKVRVNPDTTTGPTSIEDVKDVVVDLPLGFLGNAESTPKCALSRLSSLEGCPASTRVGHILTKPASGTSINSGIFNLVPEHGVAAEFGFTDAADANHILYTSVVPSPAGYILRATTREIPQAPLTNVVVTFFGNPTVKSGSGATPLAMFTNPGFCSGEPLVTTIHMDSWQAPARWNANNTPDFTDARWVSKQSTIPPMTGCDRLQFNPVAFRARPDTASADSPTGLNFELQLPQSEEPGTLSTPPLRNASVALPPGLIVNAAAAAGLTSCSPAQIGWGGGSADDFTPDAPTCLDTSKIGTVEVTTPLLANTLGGAVYLATPNENPFHSLLAGYIVIDDPDTGILAKIPGRLTLDPHSGQITGIFNDNPQLPFSDLKIRFFGGPRGELATPETCGAFTSHAVFAPWSSPGSGPDAILDDVFGIGANCTAGFAPGFSGGVTSPRAGAYSPLSLSFSRQDGEQELSGLSVSLPPGLLAKIANVAQCPEAALAAAASRASGVAEQASPSCPAASRLGTVRAGAGSGPSPLFLSGSAYFTGPYRGGPYGVAVIVPAVAGPFDLGNVVVRTSLRIDRNSAQVTAVSDPFPTIVDASGADGTTNGFPVRLRRVDVTLDRPEFVVNPTNCNEMALGSTLTSLGGTSVPVSSRFAVGGCRELSFKPQFAVATQAKTSKARGASLTVKVTSTREQANIAKVRVALPKQMPSRLTTLQKACTDSVFNSSPASCPSGSLVGSVKATTPLLSNPLSGPAYLVSHGNTAFPDLVIVLQGEGIVLYLDGATNIKHGITTSTFNAVPDAPISSFELKLPQGPDSVLAANLPTKAKGSMCGQKLVMPTVITGQNGATVVQNTKVSVAGCPRRHTIHKHKKRKKGHGHIRRKGAR